MKKVLKMIGKIIAPPAVWVPFEEQKNLLQNG